MRSEPPGPQSWTSQEISDKFRFNERKVEVLPILSRWTADDRLFTSADLADEVNISQKYASMLLLRYSRVGLVIRGTLIPSSRKGRAAIVYSGTPGLHEKVDIVKQRTKPISKKGTRRRKVPVIEL